MQTPQVFPAANLMNPLYPHDAPQEFLITQFPSLTPTKVTPWLRAVLQLLNTPLLYGDQFDASTATETTLLWIALAKSLQFLISVYPETLKGSVAILHVCLTGLYGY